MGCVQKNLDRTLTFLVLDDVFRLVKKSIANITGRRWRPAENGIVEYIDKLINEDKTRKCYGKQNTMRNEVEKSREECEAKQPNDWRVE